MSGGVDAPLGAGLVLQQVLKDEVTAWLGREWNARGDRQRQGQRNGHCDLSIKTTAGAVGLKRPKLRNTIETYASQLLGKWGGALCAVGGAIDETQRRIDAFADRHHQAFPAAVRCPQHHRQALTSYLRFPTKHHKRIQHTNLIKRTFGETRRRVKVIDRLTRTALHPSHHPTPPQHPPPTQPTCHQGEPNQHSPRRHRHSRRLE